MKHYFHSLIFFCFLSLLGGILAAQIPTESEIMKRILVDAKQKGVIIEKSGRQDLGTVCPGKSIRVRISNGILENIGIVLFHENMVKGGSLFVYDFIERYFLTLLLKPNQTQQTYLLREDFVELKIDGKVFPSGRSIVQIIKLIEPTSAFSLNSVTSEYVAQWKVNEGKTTIALRFPKQYDLILGKDKKELTQSFRRDVESFAYSRTKAIPQELATSSKYLFQRKIYADMGDTYVIPQMKTGKYIQQKGANYELVFNERDGEESLLNLFSNADEMGLNNVLETTVKGYLLSEKFGLEIDKLCAYMKANQCTAYIGLETKTETEYTGTVMYVNRDLMYKHLLYFRFPVEAFKKESSKVSATLYPYIPINNVTDLYGELKTFDKTN